MSCSGCTTWALSSPQTRWTLGILRGCDNQIRQLQGELESRVAEVEALQRKHQQLAELQRHALIREEILTQTISTQNQLIHVLKRKATENDDECMTAQTPPSPFLSPSMIARNCAATGTREHLSQKGKQS